MRAAQELEQKKTFEEWEAPAESNPLPGVKEPYGECAIKLCCVPFIL